MKRMLGVLAVVLTLGTPAFVAAGPKEDVSATPQAWAEAFNSRNPERVVALYDSEAVLWGTISPTLRDTPETIRDYFKGLPGQPQGRVVIGEHRIRVYGDTAINTGYYTFSNVRDGQPVTVPARFSFTYRQRDGRWLIVDHHSSAVPAPPRQ
jgi:uncharacterized protein (TIGR02246 family)